MHCSSIHTNVWVSAHAGQNQYGTYTKVNRSLRAVMQSNQIQILKEINREDLIESLYQHVDKCVPNVAVQEISRGHEFKSTIQDTAEYLLKACKSLSDLREVLLVTCI